MGEHALIPNMAITANHDQGLMIGLVLIFFKPHLRTEGDMLHDIPERRTARIGSPTNFF